MLDNIDPVSALIGFTGLILAVAAFLVPSVSFRKRAAIACGCIVVAGVGAGILMVMSAMRGTGPGPINVAGPTSTTTPTPRGTEPPPAPDLSIKVEIQTTDYRRTDEANSVYRIVPGNSRLDFRYGWISRTPEGDLTGNDCVVNARLTNQADSSVVENFPTNDCTRTGLHQSPPLTPGTYLLAVAVTRTGSTYNGTKTITVLPT